MKAKVEKLFNHRKDFMRTNSIVLLTNASPNGAVSKAELRSTSPSRSEILCLLFRFPLGQLPPNITNPNGVTAISFPRLAHAVGHNSVGVVLVCLIRNQT